MCLFTITNYAFGFMMPFLCFDDSPVQNLIAAVSSRVTLPNLLTVRDRTQTVALLCSIQLLFLLLRYWQTIETIVLGKK